MDFDLENPFLTNDSVAELFTTESDHMSSFSMDNANRSSRQNAVLSIFEWNLDLDPFLRFLAINYIDRFLSKHEIPSGKPWIVSLLTVACFSLASKMKNIDFSIADFQGGAGFTFDGQAVERMELVVLNALNWRMRSITPFCFVNYFATFFLPNQPSFLDDLKNRALDLFFLSQNEVRILDFKPSLIAASALLTAADELFPIQLPSFRTAISSSQFVNKEKLLECLSVMGDVAMKDCDWSSDSPATVLRAAGYLSNSENDLTVDSPPDDHRDVKKRRNGSQGKIHMYEG